MCANDASCHSNISLSYAQEQDIQMCTVHTIHKIFDFPIETTTKKNLEEEPQQKGGEANEIFIM